MSNHGPHLDDVTPFLYTLIPFVPTLMACLIAMSNNFPLVFLFLFFVFFFLFLNDFFLSFASTSSSVWCKFHGKQKIQIFQLCDGLGFQGREIHISRSKKK